MIKRVLLAAMLVAAPQGALAERPPQYWGVSLGTFELEDPNGNITETTNVGLQAGYKFTSFVGLEARGGFESGETSGALDEPELTYGGGFVRVDIPYERVNLYVLLGGGQVTYDTASGDVSESGPAGGVGIELFGSERSAVSLEYINYSSDDTTYDGLSIGFVHHFNWAVPRF